MTAAMGLPKRDKIACGYPIKMKIHFRQEANHIYFHSEWNCHSGSFKIFQSPPQHFYLPCGLYLDILYMRSQHTPYMV